MLTTGETAGALQLIVPGPARLSGALHEVQHEIALDVLHRLAALLAGQLIFLAHVAEDPAIIPPSAVSIRSAPPNRTLILFLHVGYSKQG